ncbi:MAG: sigma factor G inhibitor Gin [Bacillaceae bacterium]
MRIDQCVVCEKDSDFGIHLLEKFICDKCQKEIIHTDVDDPAYIFYIDKLKNVKIPTTI